MTSQEDVETPPKPPNILPSLIFGTTSFALPTFAVFALNGLARGHHDKFRRAAFTGLNVGAAGGLFTTTRAALLHIPFLLDKNHYLVDRDYTFASAIAAGFVGGTFNIINSRGPKMAIPGMVVFTFLGTTGQLVVNFVNRQRIQYVLSHEDEIKVWQEARRKAKTKEDLMLTEKVDKQKEWESKFEVLERVGVIKRSNADKRVKRLREEIEKLNGMIRKVDEEIKGVEMKKQQLETESGDRSESSGAQS